MKTLVVALLCALAFALAAPAGAIPTLGASGPPFPLASPTPAGMRLGVADWLAVEQGVVISTDDWSYPHSRHDAGKVDPLTGLPFARSVAQEAATAAVMNLWLRTPHQAKLLRLTSIAFPVLERSIIGSFYRPWKTRRL